MAEVKDRDEQLEIARLYHPSLPIITRCIFHSAGN